MIKRLCLALIFCMAVTTVMGQIRMPVHITGEASAPPPGDLLQMSDITYLGGFRLAYPSGYFASAILGGFAGRDFGGTPHVFVGNADDADFTYVMRFSPSEFIDPGPSNYNLDPTLGARATLYTGWGSENGHGYDYSQGLLGKTYKSDGTLETLADGGYLVIGAFFTEESATCCWMQTVGRLYGNYEDDWGTIIVDLTNRGTGVSQVGLTTTVNGPIRYCVDTAISGANCGTMRAQIGVRMPDNSFGLTMGGSATQQGSTAKGPSLFGGMAFPNLSTTSGFGTTRAGDPNLRSTDIIANTMYMNYYSMDSTIYSNGLATTPIWAARRPTHATADVNGYTNYIFEGYGSSTVGQVDPAQYSGVGSFTENDGMGGTTYISGSKHGFLSTAQIALGHTWYKTTADADFYRGSLEARGVLAVGSGCDNNDIGVIKDNTYGTLTRIRYVNDGASQPGSVTHSGGDITVHLHTDGAGLVLWTANDVKTALDGDPTTAGLTTTYLAGETFGAAHTSCGANPGTGLVTVLGFSPLAGGPQYCPLHGVETDTLVTGPQSAAQMGEFRIYDPLDLPASPDYSVDPTETAWLTDFYASFAHSDAPANRWRISGAYFHPGTRRLYMLASGVDNVAGIDVWPVVHVFQVAGTASPADDEAVANAMKQNAANNALNASIQHGVKNVEHGILLTFLFSMMIVSVRRKR